MALNANFKDFEDAIQYSTVMMNSLDIIVTRNPQDFPVAIPKILTPSQLIEEVDLIDWVKNEKWISLARSEAMPKIYLSN